jgi:hypothetical protein
MLKLKCIQFGKKVRKLVTRTNPVVEARKKVSRMPVVDISLHEDGVI